MEELGAVQQINNAAAIVVGSKPILDVERGLAKEDVAALVLQAQQCSLNGADALGRNVAVLHFNFGGMVAHILHHAAQILKV